MRLAIEHDVTTSVSFAAVPRGSLTVTYSNVDFPSHLNSLRLPQELIKIAENEDVQKYCEQYQLLP